MNELLMLLALLLIALAGFLMTPWIAATLMLGRQRLEKRLADVLIELFVFSLTPRQAANFTIGGVLTILVLFMIIFGPIAGFIIGTLLGLLAPIVYIRVRIRRRRALLEKQLLDALLTLGNGMRAGLNLPQAIGLIEKHGKGPVKQEFGLLLREIEHGTSVDVALERAGKRIKSHNFHLLFAAMRTTRRRGGNLPDTLDRLGESLREITRLEEKVKSQTAQHRSTATMMGIMPSVFLLIYAVIDPQGVSLMFTETVGQLILALVVVLNVVGFLWIRRIVNFEI